MASADGARLAARSSWIGQKSDAKKNRFLFVNKDPKSEVLSRSSGSAAASINSHVQRWKGKPGRSKAPTKTQENQISADSPLYRDCVTKFRPKPRRRSEKALRAAHQAPLTPASLNTSDTDSRAPHSPSPDFNDRASEGDDVLELRRSEQNYRPAEDALQLLTANFSGSDCVDPFRVTAIPIGKHVQPILQYYISFTLVSTFSGDSEPKGSAQEPSHFPAIRNIVRGSLYNQMHSYALLAATAGRMKRVSGINLTGESSPEFLMHNAIRCLRGYFTTCSGFDCVADRQIILDIFYLCVCEWYENSFDGARTHLAFVKYFWNSLSPSTSSLDRYIHDMISYNDVFLAIETASPPMFTLTWDPPMLSNDRIQEIEIDTRRSSFTPDPSLTPTSTSAYPSPSNNSLSLSTTQPGSGFTALLTAPLRSPIVLPALQPIIISLIPLITIIHHHTNSPTAPSPIELQWASLKSQALLHRLLSLCLTGPSECLRLPLIILLATFSTSAAWRSGKVDMTKLARNLKNVLSVPLALRFEEPRFPMIPTSDDVKPLALWEQDAMEPGMLLWVLVTGAFAAAGSWAEEHWFLVQAIRVARMMNLETDGVRGELRRWLYVEHLEGMTVERLLAMMRSGK